MTPHPPVLAGRLPILTYFYRRRGSSLVRCAQPMVGATGRRSEADEFLICAVRNTSPDPTLLVIFDARSSLAELGNKMMGKGSEIARNYPNTKLLFMEIANIHAVRASADALQALCEDGSDQKWLSQLEATGWLYHVKSILSASCAIARKMCLQQLSCVVHCSDGWDRTSQLISLCQLMLDPCVLPAARLRPPTRRTAAAAAATATATTANGRGSVGLCRAVAPMRPLSQLT